jgi:hypothetical protein
MTQVSFVPTRRRILSAAAGTAVLGTGWVGSALAQPKEFKIGFFIALSGPASLFGPTQRACADLAAEKINKAGGILGRPVKLIFTDAGGRRPRRPSRRCALMLEDKVDLFIGSHDSATREANIATIKGKVPYIYSPVYEGGECSPNVFCLGETPPQQAQPAIEFLAKEKNAKTFHLIGDDYVWPRKVQRAGEEVRRRVRRQGRRRGVRAVRRAEQVRGGGHAHQGGQARRGVRTLVGADNVNFNRTFAGFGLDKTSPRCRCCSRRTRCSASAPRTAQPVLVHGLLREQPVGGAEGVQGRVHGQYGDKAPQLATIGADCYSALNLAKALFDKAGSADCEEAAGRVRGPAVRQRVGPRDDARPPGRQGHVPRQLQGHAVRGHQDHQGVKSGTPAAPERAGSPRRRWSRVVVLVAQALNALFGIAVARDPRARPRRRASACSAC